MIRDTKLIFSEAQAATGASSVVSDYTLNVGAEGDAISKDMYLVVLCDTAADSAGDAATVTVSLQTDDADTFGSATTLFATGAIAQASCVAGAVLAKVKVPIGVEQYLRVVYTIGTENLTAGKFDAFLVSDVDVSF